MKELFKDKSAPIRVICLAAAVITLILGFLNGALNLSFLEKDTYMYARGSESFLSAYYTLCALTAAISVVLYAVLRIKKLDASAPLLSVKEKSERSVAWVLRYIGGALFTVGALIRFGAHFTSKASAPLPGFITVLMLLFFACFSLYFFPEVCKQLGSDSLASACGLLGAIAFIVDTLTVYADMSLPIASDYRLFTAIYSVLFLLALVSELRIKLSAPAPYAYTALLVIATTVGGSTCIGRMIYLCSGAQAFGTELLRTVCGFGVTLYLLSRLISVAFVKTQESTAERSEEPQPECDEIAQNDSAVNE